MNKKDLTSMESDKINNILSKAIVEQKIENISSIINNSYYSNKNNAKSHRQLLQEILSYSFSCNHTYLDYIENNIDKKKSCNIYFFKDDICVIECYTDYNSLNINRFIRRIDENTDENYIFFIKKFNEPFDIFNMVHMQYTFS